MQKQNFKQDFNLGETIWIDSSQQGPMPKKAIEAVQKAISLKANPALLDVSLFSEVSSTLKQALAKMLGSNAVNIVLGNSATYFVRLLAEGLNFNEGDEIILAKGDFPTNILSWQPLKKKGVKIIKVEFDRDEFNLDQLKKHVTERTRLICVSWVNSFNGYLLDEYEFVKFCNTQNIISCLNGSQALGYKDFNVSELNVDVLFTCGYKWLLGPYGTGFGYFSDKIFHELDYNNISWLDYMDPELEDMRSIGDIENPVSKNYDVFGTANFMNFMPWKESINYLLNVGIENITKHNFALVDIINTNLSREKYRFISNTDTGQSSIVVIEPLHEKVKDLHGRLLSKNIYVSIRQGKIRISPHIYNDENDISALLKVLEYNG